MEGTYLNGKWLLEARLGAGGVATVYRATHRNGTRVAIKILSENCAEDADVRRRFLREGYVANSVGHPGAVRVLDDNTTEDGRVFLVMELLDGEALDQRCKRLGGRLPLDEAVRYTEAILDVLAAAHTKGIVHRDIKPANVFITSTGGVKVLDFGLAKMRSAIQGDATAVGALLGTPGYMAPEVARATRDDDARADVWSVGATLFKLLAGRHPFEATDTLSLLVATTRERPRALRDVAPDVPEPIAAVVDRALAVEPEGRWRDAQAMQDALRAAKDGVMPSRRVVPSFADIADENDPTMMSSPLTPGPNEDESAPPIFGKSDEDLEDERTVLSDRAPSRPDLIPSVVEHDGGDVNDTSGFTEVMRDAPVRFQRPGAASSEGKAPVASAPPSSRHARLAAVMPRQAHPVGPPLPRPVAPSASRWALPKFLTRQESLIVIAVGLVAGIILIVVFAVR